MSVDLFLKNVPALVKELIGREALENRRSVNQEAIALLEEALVHRVEGMAQRPRTALQTLRKHVESQPGEPGAVTAQVTNSPVSSSA